MPKKHGPEATKTWVHLTDDDVHLFDQTSGLVEADSGPEHSDGMTDEERIARAGVIGNGWATSAGSGF